MSIFRTVQIACDHGYMTDEPCPEFVEGIPAEPAGDVRKVAYRQGWVRLQGRDYCRKHAGSSEGSA